MSIPITPVLPKFDNTLGALLVGGLLATALWGVTSLQTATYFQKSSDAPLRSKLIVALLWCLDTFDTFLNCHILYHYLVTNFMNPLALASPVWSILIHVLITSLTDFIIRCLFARRIYRLSHQNYLLTGGAIAISIIDLTCGIMITVKAFQIHTWVDLKALSTLFYLNFAAGFSGDLYVALALCYYLYKSRTGFMRTDTLIKTLIGYTINTGLLTAFDAMLGMLFYIIMPTNFIFITFYLLLSKLYTNSYLATLNAREHLFNRGDVVSIHMSHLAPEFRGYGASAGTTLPATTGMQKRSNDIAINVETVINTKTDTYGDYSRKIRQVDSHESV